MSTNSSSSTNSSGTIEVSNPLFLGPLDNPSTILVSKIFDGSGFSMWKRLMILALSAKNKLGFVDGLNFNQMKLLHCFKIGTELTQWL